MSIPDPIRISQYGRSWVYWPFWDLQGNTPSISVDGVNWFVMSAQLDYIPKKAVSVGAEWFRVLIAGTKASSNPDGTMVVSAPRNNILFRAGEDDEIEIPTDDWQVIEVV